MLLKPTVAAAATLALTAALAPPAHAVEVPMCTATAPGGHTRAYCSFVGPPGYYKVTITSRDVRYAWARLECPNSSPLETDAWDTAPDSGYDEVTGFQAGGTCTLTVAAGANTQTTPGHATGVAYYKTP